MSEWIKNLKVGDEVIVDTGPLGWSPSYVARVVRLTKTLIVVAKASAKKGEGEAKFKRTGSSGGGFSSSDLVEPTEAAKNEITRLQYASHLGNFNGWKKLPLDVLQQIYKLKQDGIG